MRQEMTYAIEELEEVEVRVVADTGQVLESLKELNNEYQTLIGSIRVNVRIRPLLGMMC